MTSDEFADAYETLISNSLFMGAVDDHQVMQL